MLQNSQDMKFINQDYRQNHYKIPKRHGCFPTQNILRNINQLRMSLGRTEKGSASPGRIETIVWNRYSYQVTSMVRTDA